MIEKPKMQAKSLKILLVEDNPADVRLIQETLAETLPSGSISSAFDIDSAEKLSIGLELGSTHTYDIILCDLSLPDSYGLETFKKVHEKNPKTPIVVLSGLNDESMAVEAVREGAQDYLVKGQIDGTLLLRAMRYAIERKRTESELKSAYKKLKELDQLKSDFLSTVSHELKTPIAIMREGVSLCLDGIAGETTETQQELLGDTLENVDRLNRLVMDLLDVSKIEAGKIKLRKEMTNVSDIAIKCVEGYQAQAENKKIQIEKLIEKKSIRLYVDKDKVIQIFNNLISNAIRYSNEESKITVELKNEKEYVKCRVSDTGIGIEKENISKLFSKFEQFGRVDGPGYKGTGLGLTIAKGLVEIHGGAIWAESEIGKGTTFWFTLKKGPLPVVLVVDDEMSVVDTVKEILMEQGYQFIEAYDGLEAVGKAISQSPSLILLDMRLPAMSGYEVIGRLKQDRRTNNIPIVIMSAFSINQNKLDQMNLHAAIPVLKKPFEPHDLKNIVRDSMNHSTNQ